jgi:hypothetical protein
MMVGTWDWQPPARMCSIYWANTSCSTLVGVFQLCQPVESGEASEVCCVVPPVPAATSSHSPDPSSPAHIYLCCRCIYNNSVPQAIIWNPLIPLVSSPPDPGLLEALSLLPPPPAAPLPPAAEPRPAAATATQGTAAAGNCIERLNATLGISRQPPPP